MLSIQGTRTASFSIGYLNGTSFASIAFITQSNNYVSFTIANDLDAVLMYPIKANTTVTFVNLQLEVGTVQTIYEAYRGSTLPINWQTEAGTIYGGTVTLNEDGSADVVKTYGVIDLSTVDWQYTPVQHRFYRGGYNDFDFGVSQSGQPQIICNVYAPSVWAQFVSGSIDYACGANSGNVSVRDERYDDDVTAFKAYLASVGAIFVAPLASSASQIYHFPNIGQLYTFLGTNNVWIDTGDVEVEYPADTKLYIDGKIAEMQATILENIGG